MNDTLGHAAGDDALRQVGRVLKDIGRSTGIFARLGGDEFGALLVRCGGEPAALGLAARLGEELARRPWPSDVTVSATVGYHSLRRSDSPSGALHRADLAMLSRKTGRRR